MYHSKKKNVKGHSKTLYYLFRHNFYFCSHFVQKKEYYLQLGIHIDENPIEKIYSSIDKKTVVLANTLKYLIKEILYFFDNSDTTYLNLPAFVRSILAT